VERADMKEDKKVALDPSKLQSGNVTRAEKELLLPELNKVMGVKEGEVVTMKIKQLDLEEYLYCQTQADDKIRNLVEGAIAAAEKMGEFEEEILSIYKSLSPRTRYYIDICMKGVIDPKMTRRHWIFMSKNFPLTMEKISTEIILLTKGGADLKKNL
jgi:hypothetical protein